MTPPPAVLAPNVALERLIERLREPRTMSQFMGPHDMALALLRERATLADELATLRAGLAQQGEAVAVCQCGAPCRKEVLMRGGENGWGDDASRTVLRYVPPITHPAAVDAAMVESVRKAMRRAFALGQTYWQQADSEYTSQHRKADDTMAKFKALTEETAAALQPAASEGEKNV